MIDLVSWGDNASASLSVAVPSRNAAQHFDSLIAALSSIKDQIELCVFDNGSDDGLLEKLKSTVPEWSVRYMRSPVAVPISTSWLAALQLGTKQIRKLQSADDMPIAGGIEAAVRMLEEDSSLAFVVGSSVACCAGLTPQEEKSVKQYISDCAVNRRRMIGLDDGFSGVLNHMLTSNPLGDIFAVVLRWEALKGLSALRQNYYSCSTHPDVEIYAHLLSNGNGAYIEEAIVQRFTRRSDPWGRSHSDWEFAAKVYELPAAIQPFVWLLDPGYSVARSRASSWVVWRAFVRSLWRLFRVIREARKRDMRSRSKPFQCD